MLILGVILCHVVRELWEHDARIGELGHPALDPFQRDKAGIIDAGQRRHHVIQRQIAFAHELIAEHAVLERAVLGLHELDIVAERRDGLLRRFAAVAVRMMHIPDGCDMNAADLVEHRLQALGITEYAVCLHKQRDVMLFRLRDQGGQHLCDIVVINNAGHLAVTVAEHADIGRADSLCKLHAGKDLSTVLCLVVLLVQAAVRADARDLQLEGFQLCDRFRQHQTGERLAAVGVGRQSVAAELDAVKAEVLCHGVYVRPFKIRTAQRGKTDLHSDTSQYLCSKKRCDACSDLTPLIMHVFGFSSCRFQKTPVHNEAGL